MPHFPKPFFRASRGLWYIQIAGKQHNLGRCTEEEAVERAVSLKKQLKNRPVVNSDSLAAIIDAFLEWVQNNRSVKTYGWFQYRLQRFVEKYPDMRASDLLPLHVTQWVDGYKFSVTSRRNYLRAVKRCLTWATKQGYLTANPVANLEVPAAENRDRPVTPEVFEEFLTAVKRPQYRDLLKLAWLSGGRPQELIRAEARHLDVVNQRFVFPVKESKGKKKVRVVYLPGEALDIVKRLIDEHPEGRLLRNAHGTPWTTFAINCLMRRLGKKTGHWHALYDFRHGYATRMLKAGVDPVTVGVLMGHANPAMVASVYQHLSQSPLYLLDQAKKAIG